MYVSMYVCIYAYTHMYIYSYTYIPMCIYSNIFTQQNTNSHMNPEPITTRWMRGITWRMAREVIFGIGLNQMSDYCEERIPASVTSNEALRTMGGSMIAGVVYVYIYIYIYIFLHTYVYIYIYIYTYMYI